MVMEGEGGQEKVRYALKVHKIENFFGFDFEICTISLLVMSKYKILQKIFFVCAIIGGVTIFPHGPRQSCESRRQKNSSCS